MKLFGFGPWGVEDVSRATGIPVRTLHEWHRRQWATASDRTSGRGCLRYERGDAERVARIAALRAKKIDPKRAADLLDAMDVKLAEVFATEPRPIVTFA